MQLLLICQIKFGEINPDIAALKWLVVMGWWLRRGCVDARNRAIICHLLSAVLGFDKPFGRLRRALDRRRLPSAVCRPLSAVCCPPSAVCRPLSAVRRPLSRLKRLSPGIRDGFAEFDIPSAEEDHEFSYCFGDGLSCLGRHIFGIFWVERVDLVGGALAIHL
jgi:hypothetical protein